MTNETIVIAYNGPPKSGKTHLMDYTLKHIKNMHPEIEVTSMAFSDPMYAAISAAYNIPFIEIMALSCSSKKDDPHPYFFGKSLREVAISFSETWLKPFHADQSIFSKVLARDGRLISATSKKKVIILDTGFDAELFGFLDRINGLTHSTLIRLEREGTSFVKDSRNYIVDDSIADYSTRSGNHIVAIDYNNMNSISSIHMELNDYIDQTIEGTL